MKQRIFAALLALTMCLTLLPTTAFAAEKELPDWYFLFAIIKNVDADVKDGYGKISHVKYSMTEKEVESIRGRAPKFEEYMNSTGVMRAHVTIVEIDTPLKELYEDENWGFINAEQAAPLLENVVDLDQYDHVFTIVSLNTWTGWAGMTHHTFENGTGHSCINSRNEETTLKKEGDAFPIGTYVHEFLHFASHLSEKFGAGYGLHEIGDNRYYASDSTHRNCYTDIILNRAKGSDGTGVYPAAWQYPPRVLRTMTELTIPAGVTGIGDRAFENFTALTKVTIPGSVRSLGYGAFLDCTSLREATIAPGLPAVGEWGFGRCTGLTKVTIPASVTSIGKCAFFKTALTDVYYGGTEEQWKAIQIGEYNDPLTKANIHYNSGSVPVVTVDNIPARGTAYASTQNITIDGKAVKFDAYALKDEKGNPTNYIKLRDLAQVLNGTAAQFSVGYDNTAKAISVTAGEAYTPNGSEMKTPFSGDRAYTGGQRSMTVNGGTVEMNAITLTDNSGGGYTYFKLRDLGTVLGFQVSYSRETGISINTTR